MTRCRLEVGCSGREPDQRTGERGFVLVTALVLLAILTILGVASSYKSIVEIKVSKVSGDMSKALEAANAGLQQIYWYWNSQGADTNYAGYNELISIIDYVQNGGPTTPVPYNPALTGETLAALRTAAGGNLDAYIRNGNNVRVYQYVANNGVTTGIQVVSNSQWGKGSVPQVAVWATSYKKQVSGAYPYLMPNSGACPDCNLVVYALGRMGETRRLVREIQGVATRKLEGVAALTNASPWGNWSEACSETTPPVSTGSVKAWNSSLKNTVIDVTQAPYLRSPNDPASAPSGVGILSNTAIGGGGKGFRSKTSSTTGTSFENTPMLLYAGHGPNAADNQARADLASKTVDNTAPYNNLPAGQLPHNLVKGPLIGSALEPVAYFPNGVSQLLNLDMYRWAAEQFTCQDVTKADGTAGNGRYCSKAEALRQAVDALWFAKFGVHATAPVTGRLTAAEFEYNVNYGIPMFGIIRVMAPTQGTGTTFSCASLTSEFYNVSGSFSTLTTNSSGGSGPYDGSPLALDSDGTLDGTARVLVYGSLFFDFFTDNNANDVFDPANNERLLLPLEAADSYMKIEMPILINPAMPRLPAAPLAFPTAKDLNGNGVHDDLVAMNNTGAAVDLASPSGGFFPLSEGLLPMTDSNTYANGLMGTMRLMTNTPLDGLVDMANNLNTSYSAAPGNASLMFSNHKAELEYYYNILVATAMKSDVFSWPIAPFPATITGNFYIGAEDAAAGSNDGDRLHLLFPSGYMHGWKVALAALDMTAADWNALMTGVGALAAQHNIPKNFGDPAMPKGSPFNVAKDPGFANASSIESSETAQHDYFYVEAGAGGYAKLTDKWRDIPAEMYVGGLLDMHAHSNINGLVYTPGPLEWEPGNSSYGGNSNHLSYINGSIITGFGAYLKNKVAQGRYVLVYANEAVDNINTNNMILVMRRYARMEVR